MSDTTPSNDPQPSSFQSADDSPVAPPEPTRGGVSARTWIIAGAVTAIVVVGVIWFMGRSDSSNTASSAAPAAAGQQGRGMPGASGTISKISGSTITVKADDGTETKIATNADTVVTLTSDVKVGDIAVGDQLTVTGTVDGTTITAERVNDMGDVQLGQRGQGQNGQQGGNFTPPTDANGNIMGRGQGQNGGQAGQNGQQGPGVGMTAGQVTAVNGNTVTITGRNGTTYTVTITASTTITKDRTGKVSDLKVGDAITAFGQSDNGTLTATRITQGTLGLGGGLGVAGGRGGNQSTTTTR